MKCIILSMSLGGIHSSMIVTNERNIARSFGVVLYGYLYEGLVSNIPGRRAKQK